jgi:hypothetical protein
VADKISGRSGTLITPENQHTRRVSGSISSPAQKYEYVEPSRPSLMPRYRHAFVRTKIQFLHFIG